MCFSSFRLLETTIVRLARFVNRLEACFVFEKGYLYIFQAGLELEAVFLP